MWVAKLQFEMVRSPQPWPLSVFETKLLQTRCWLNVKVRVQGGSPNEWMVWGVGGLGTMFLLSSPCFSALAFISSALARKFLDSLHSIYWVWFSTKKGEARWRKPGSSGKGIPIKGETWGLCRSFLQKWHSFLPLPTSFPNLFKVSQMNASKLTKIPHSHYSIGSIIVLSTFANKFYFFHCNCLGNFHIPIFEMKEIGLKQKQ